MFSQYVLRWINAWNLILEFAADHTVILCDDDGVEARAKRVGAGWLILGNDPVDCGWGIINDGRFIYYLGLKFNIDYMDISSDVISWVLFNGFDIKPGVRGIEVTNRANDVSVGIVYDDKNYYTAYGDEVKTGYRENEIIAYLDGVLNA